MARGQTGPRQIPAYKRIVKPGEGQSLAEVIAPRLDDAALAAVREKNAAEAAERVLDQSSKIPHKILTTNEIRSRIIALMNERHYDPIRELIKIANNTATDQETRISIHKELAQYIAPKLKSTDLQISGDLTLTVNVLKFTGAMAQNREAIPVRATAVESNFGPERLPDHRKLTG